MNYPVTITTFCTTKVTNQAMATSFACISPMQLRINCTAYQIIVNSYNIGRRALFSYRTRYDVTEFSNCYTEERNEAEFF